MAASGERISRNGKKKFSIEQFKKKKCVNSFKWGKKGGLGSKD